MSVRPESGIICVGVCLYIERLQLFCVTPDGTPANDVEQSLWLSSEKKPDFGRIESAFDSPSSLPSYDI